MNPWMWLLFVLAAALVLFIVIVLTAGAVKAVRDAAAAKPEIVHVRTVGDVSEYELRLNASATTDPDKIARQVRRQAISSDLLYDPAAARDARERGRRAADDPAGEGF